MLSVWLYMVRSLLLEATYGLEEVPLFLPIVSFNCHNHPFHSSFSGTMLTIEESSLSLHSSLLEVVDLRALETLQGDICPLRPFDHEWLLEITMALSCSAFFANSRSSIMASRSTICLQQLIVLTSTT